MFQPHGKESLEDFRRRLQERCQDDGPGDEGHRSRRLQNEAQQARALADEFGILKQAGISWEELRAADPELRYGTEHICEFAAEHQMWGKITIPGQFGLIPGIVSIPQANLPHRDGTPGFRKAIEFLPATPLEYLQRWMDANEVLGDDVRLESVIEWSDGRISFGITQPHCHGEPAEPRDIERYFKETGWTPIPDTTGHRIFYNYNWQVMAIDAEPRNCYINEGLLLPFDVLLCRPDEELETHLNLYATGPSSSPSGT